MAGLPYLIVYVVAAATCLLPRTPRFNQAFVYSFGLALVVFVGLRHEVGGDWNGYLSWIAEDRGISFAKGLQRSDLAYGLLNWLGSNWFGGIYLVNVVCAAVAAASLAYFCSRMPDPVMAMAIAIPYLVTVVFMGYTRQGAAIGLTFVALTMALDRKLWRYLIFIGLAATFHKTALFMLIFLPAANPFNLSRKQIIVGVVAVAVVIGLALIFLQDRWVPVLELYVLNSHGTTGLEEDSEGVHSSGAIVRLFMSVAAGAVFAALVFKDKYSRLEKRVWGTAAMAAFVLFTLAFLLSTFADRLGLYFISLQIFVFSSLPFLFEGMKKFFLRLAILAVYGASLLVWLNFGSHSQSWLPYQSALAFVF